jgi:hypothetical protein
LAFGKASRFLGDARRFLRRVSMRPGEAALCFGGASRMLGSDALLADAASWFLADAAFAACDAAFMGSSDPCFVRRASCRFHGASSLPCRVPLRLGEACLQEGKACLCGDHARWLEDRASFREAEAR